MFSWYGSRLLYSVDYLKKLLAGLSWQSFRLQSKTRQNVQKML